jgi:hypothetical protein
LLLGAGTAQDQMVLDGDNYTDLIMSNLVAGVMLGHLVDTYTPGIQYHKDYLYGSVLAQLMQENIATQMYKSSGDQLAPSADQQSVMGAGQGGPYQINNYAADMLTGSYTPGGGSLINFVALQKNIGYSMASAPLQYTKPTPASFNNKYFGPLLTAYFHFNDLRALVETGKGSGGWMTPWQPAFDKGLTNFKTLPNNFLDILLNVSYNQGSYGPLMKFYSDLAATASPSTLAQVNDYKAVWGSKDTYQQYPYQVRYYLDQLYGNPVPTTSPTTLAPSTIHVAIPVPTLATVFSKSIQTLGYVNASGVYNGISDAQARNAFNSGLASVGVADNATLDLSVKTQRAQIFKLLETAITQLASTLGTRFTATTLQQL